MALMNEQQRQAYLSAMGIQTYFPRRVVPGAKISPRYDLRPIEELLERPADSGVEHSKAEEEGSSRPVIQVDPLQTKIRPSRNQLETQPAPSIEATDSTLRFKLRYFSINQNLSVIDEYPYLQSGNDSGRSLALLQSILRALAVIPAIDAFQSESFNWPLTQTAPLQGNDDLARQALNGFIRRRFETHGFKCMIVFSSQLDRLIVPESETGNATQTTYPGLGFQVTLTKSLHTLLSVPALKKEAWQDMQSIKETLTDLSATAF